MDPETSRPGRARGTAHARLRSDTRGAHEAVERHLDLTGLAARPGYDRFLLMNWACASIEQALAQAGVARLLPDWPARARRTALERDLLTMNLAPPRVEARFIAGDAGSLFGWAYVLEGSRLGARLILRTVETSADRDVRGSTCFLRHGEGKGFWLSFVAALSAIDDDAVAIERACAAAREGFGLFRERAERKEAVLF